MPPDTEIGSLNTTPSSPDESHNPNQVEPSIFPDNLQTHDHAQLNTKANNDPDENEPPDTIDSATQVSQDDYTLIFTF